MMKRWIGVGLLIILPMLMLKAQSGPTKDLVDSITLSGDRQIMGVSYFRSTIIDFFDVNTGEFIKSINLSPYGFGDFALNPSGDQLIWTGSSGEIGLYDITSDTHELLAQPGSLRHLSWFILASDR